MDRRWFEYAGNLPEEANVTMELRQLAYFVAVAEAASFTRAAAKVHVAQPGVSAQIRQLERELDQALFDRSGRTVRLTTVISSKCVVAGDPVS